MAKKINELVGIDRDIFKDSLWGIVIGVVILVVGFIIPGIGSLGVPSVPQSLSSAVSMFIVVVVLASIFETLSFFDVIISFFDDKVEKFIGIKVPFLVSAILASLLFSLFHLSAYGGFSSASGAFVSAFVMGLVFSYERKIFNSNLPGIFTHALINWWIVWGSLAIVI